MGPEGLRTTLVLPALDELQQYGRVELDAALDCTGPLDRHCPAWDHGEACMGQCRGQGLCWMLAAHTTRNIVISNCTVHRRVLTQTCWTGRGIERASI